MLHTVHGRPAVPVLAALLIAALSFALSQTLVVPALPHIAETFSSTTAASSWVVTGYLLSASVCTPLAGKFGDLFGKARVLTIILLAFSVGSLVCALAGSIEVLIAGRIVQGVGGGVFPLAFGIINDEFPADKRAVAIGTMSAMFGIGGGIGLPLSGVIVDNADLSWLFWLGLLAAPAAVGITRYVPPSPARDRTRIDWAGAVLLSAGLAALLLGISNANEWGWGSARIVGLLVGGVAVLAAFVALELRVVAPLVDMRVLRSRPVLATNVTGLFIGMAMFGSFLLVPLFVQTPESAGYGFGMSVTSAGLLLVPSSVAMLVAGPLGGALGNRFGFRAILAIGTGFAAVSFGLLAVAHGAPWHFIVANVLVGVGISFSFSSMVNLIVLAVPREDVGVATGINTIARTVGGAFGAAIVTVLLTSETIAGTGLPTETAYTEAFAASMAIALVALLTALAIPRLRRGGPAADSGLPRVDDVRGERSEPALARQSP